MNIIELKKYDTVNGPGIRCSIWVAGCSNYCKGCWSKKTWNPNQGKPFKEIREEILEVINNPRISGISILGGDPFYYFWNHGETEIFELLSDCVNSGKKVWVWTGYKKEQLDQRIKDLGLNIKLSDYIDILIDGKFEEDKKDLSLYWRGSSNQRVLNLKDYEKEKN